MPRYPRTRRTTRRAAVALWTALTATLMMGFGALAIDLGYVRFVKEELQNAADASAMAGVSALMNPAALTGSIGAEQLAVEARRRAKVYAEMNYADGRLLKLNPADILVGNITNPENLQESIGNWTQGAYPFHNAVRVILQKNPAGPNDPVALFFAGIWGKHHTSLSATATAYMDNRVGGYRPRQSRGPLIPISVLKSAWTSQIVNGTGLDQYGYDALIRQVVVGPDGIKEISIYPNKQNSTGGSGNFGILNFNNANNQQQILTGQLTQGLRSSDLTAQLGEPEVRFYTESGLPRIYQIPGNTGLTASMDGPFDSLVGKIVGFFIHSQTTLTGSNTIFTVVGMEFGRVVASRLTGSDKLVIIQPVTYSGPEIILSEVAAGHSTSGRIKLIR